jgi:hypothetical protein
MWNTTRNFKTFKLLALPLFSFIPALIGLSMDRDFKDIEEQVTTYVSEAINIETSDGLILKD